MWKNFQEFLSSQLKGGLTPPSSLLEYDSVQSGSCGTKILVEFDLKFLSRSQTLLYNKTVNLKPLYITRKVANPTNHQNLPNPVKIILLTLITPIQMKSQSMAFSGSSSEFFHGHFKEMFQHGQVTVL